MNHHCELLDLLFHSDDDFVRFVLKQGGYSAVARMPTEVHHIFGGTSRLDRKANLIRLALPVHHFFVHDRPQEGRVACLYRQKQLGKLDWGSLDICAGRDVKGLLSSKPLAGIYEKWRRELLT